MSGLKSYSTICFVLLCTAIVRVTWAFEVNTSNGHELKWDDSDLPFVYSINDNGTPDCIDEFEAIHAAYAAWESVATSYMSFSYGGTTANTDWGVADNVNLHLWVESNWGNITGAGSMVIAINSVWYHADGTIIDSDIIYNGENFRWSCSGGGGVMDVQNLATHEIGHSLSLADLYNGEDFNKTMFGYVTLGEIKKRTLHPDDMAGISFLYPRGEYDENEPPTMEEIIEVEALYYCEAPTFSNFGFDDNVALDDGWYLIDLHTGTWTTLFRGVKGQSWDNDGWTVPIFHALSEGSHTIYFKADDDAGNRAGQSGEWSWQFYKDTNSPGPPVDLRTSPEKWTNENSFVITWIDPEDMAGIEGAYYTFDREPQSDTDGFFSSQRPLVVHVPKEGIRTLYLWLQDRAGNTNRLDHSSAMLAYDGTEPTLGTILVEYGTSETETLAVMLTGLSALDSLSGVEDMQFSNDGEVWSEAEPYDTVKIDWDLSGHGGTLEPGAKTVYVRYGDAAGNWSEPFSDEILYVPPLRVVTTELRPAVVNVPYSVTLEACGGEGPYVWSLVSGSLPEGLNLCDSGDIHGTPISPDAFTAYFTVNVSDIKHVADRRDLSIEVRKRAKGDVNGDGETNILDGIAVVNIILGDSCFVFKEEYCQAADWTEDSVVNILDVIGLVNFILGSGNRLPKPSLPFSVSVGMNVFEYQDPEARFLRINAESTGPIAGAQLRLKSDSKICTFGLPQVTRRSCQMTVQSEVRGDELVVLLYSFEGGSIPANFGPILEIPFSRQREERGSEGELHIEEAVFVNSAGQPLAVALECSTGGREALRPVECALRQNYPNPFNAETEIVFDLTVETKMTLIIYNLLGQVVDELVDAELDAGYHVVKWNATDLPSGVYFCSMKAGEFTASRPMVLMK